MPSISPSTGGSFLCTPELLLKLTFAEDCSDRPHYSITYTDSFVFLSDECFGFKVSTSIYNGTVLITWQDNAFYSIQFRDMELKILGISNAEKVLDTVKDYVENGEVWG